MSTPYKVDRTMDLIRAKIALMRSPITITPGLVRLHSILMADPFGVHKSLQNALLSGYKYIYDDFVKFRYGVASDHIKLLLYKTLDQPYSTYKPYTHFPLTKDLVNMFNDIYKELSRFDYRSSANVPAMGPPPFSDEEDNQNLIDFITMLKYHISKYDTDQTDDIYFIENFTQKAKTLISIGNINIYTFMSYLLTSVYWNNYERQETFSSIKNKYITDTVLVSCPFDFIKHLGLVCEDTNSIMTTDAKSFLALAYEVINNLSDNDSTLSPIGV